MYSVLNLDFDDDVNDYLIYKMKLNIPENSSLFDLNYQFIEDLVKNKDNFISKIPEEEHVEKLKFRYWCYFIEIILYMNYFLVTII